MPFSRAEIHKAIDTVERAFPFSGEGIFRERRPYVTVPEVMKNDTLALKWNSKAVPVQKEKDGRATFVVERLKNAAVEELVLKFIDQKFAHIASA